jgi:hypothetical protein
VVLSQAVTITGKSDNTTQILADPAAQVGCVGALPSGCELTNNGYAVEISAGAADIVTLDHLLIDTGTNGTGALKINSGNVVNATHDVFRGNDTITGSVVSIAPGGSAQTQVYMSNGEVSFNKNGGGVLVAPAGGANSKLHFNHMEVHHAAFGIKTDASALASGSSIATFVSESEFFSFTGSAVTALSIGGAGSVNSVYNDVNILNTTGPAVNANGPNSVVILTNSTLGGNLTGVRVIGGATVYSSVDNTIKGNGANVSGSMTPSPKQ